MIEPLIEVKNLTKYFSLPVKHGQKPVIAKAVDHVSFDVKKGEVLGIVGESGCGKTITGKMMLKLIEPTSGEIFFDRTDIVKLCQRKFRPFRKDMQTVFQDPNAALDPKMTIEKIILEPIHLHRIVEQPKELREVHRLLETVGMEPSVGKAMPHELSSGQKQRIAIAKAISTRPRFILCDEPVSALDVSIQSQVLNLLLELKNMVTAQQLTN